MFWGWGFRFVQIKGLNIIPFGVAVLMNHWPECIDIWYESSFGRGDSRVFK